MLHVWKWRLGKMEHLSLQGTVWLWNLELGLSTGFLPSLRPWKLLATLLSIDSEHSPITAFHSRHISHSTFWKTLWMACYQVNLLCQHTNPSFHPPYGSPFTKNIMSSFKLLTLATPPAMASTWSVHHISRLRVFERLVLNSWCYFETILRSLWACPTSCPRVA